MSKSPTTHWQRNFVTRALIALALTSCFGTACAQTADELLRRGDQFAASGSLVEARTAYEQAIQAGASLGGDFAHLHSLGTAYLNGEPHDYAKAAKWLQAAIQVNPADREARLQLANALAWGRDFDRAIEQYRALLNAAPGDRTLGLQIARVLSWARRYPESIAAYDGLLKQQSDDSLLVERARVLSWSGKYAEADRVYGGVLAHDPKNSDARLGRAQVLYWSGNVAAAQVATRDLLNSDPKNPDASFLMAAIEHSRGNDGEARQWLGAARQDADSRTLRSAIESGARPVLHAGFGFEDDREDPAQGLASTYRTLRYTAGVEFNITRSVRMDLSNTVTQNATSTPILAQFGEDSLATQTRARVYFSPKPWLRMEIGAGEGSSGADAASRRQHFLYEFHPVMSRGPFRLDFEASRQIADYTPLAVALGLVQDRQTLAPSYTWKRRVHFGGEYWHGFYNMRAPDTRHSLDTQANGGAVYVNPVMYSTERFTVEAGVRYELFGFSDRTVQILDPASVASSGIFMPRMYQRYAGTASMSWTPQRRVSIETHGSFGPQRVFGFRQLDPPPASFGVTGSFGTRLSLNAGRLQPYIAYDWFSTETPSGAALQVGNFASHVLSGGLRFRL